MFITMLNKRKMKWTLFFDEYDFKIKYKSNNLNSTNVLLKRLNYENDVLNNTCLSILQNKLQNIIVAIIKITKNEFNEKKISLKNENEKKIIEQSNIKLIKFFKQLIRRTNTKKICETKSIYIDFNKKILKQIKELQVQNKYC